jgi:hypothetical protein
MNNQQKCSGCEKEVEGKKGEKDFWVTIHRAYDLDEYSGRHDLILCDDCKDTLENIDLGELARTILEQKV